MVINAKQCDSFLNAVNEIDIDEKNINNFDKNMKQTKLNFKK